VRNRKEGLRNPNLQDQLQLVLEKMHKEAAKKVARRVAVEEKIKLSRNESVALAKEVGAWEGRPIYMRDKPDAKERKVFCKRVGTDFVLVCERGEEPQKVYKTPDLHIRTNEERLLEKLDQRIAETERRNCARISQLGRDMRRKMQQFQGDMDRLTAFRRKVYQSMVSSGRIIRGGKRGE